jgi:hypothetical protein
MFGHRNIRRPSPRRHVRIRNVALALTLARIVQESA